MATIACVDLDPLLVDLVRRVRPGDQVVEVTAEELQSSRASRWGAVVMPAGSDASGHLFGQPLAERTVLIGDARATHPGPALRRPVDGADLRHVLSRVMRPPGRIPGLAAYLRDLPQSVGAPGLLVVARATAVAAAVGLDVASNASGAGVAVPWAVTLALLWATLRIPVSRLNAPLVAVDIAVVVALLVAAGGATSPYLLVAAVVASEVAFAFRPRVGATLVAVGTLAGLGQLGLSVLDGRANPMDLIAFGSLIPLASLTGVLGARIARTNEDDHLRTLRQLNQTLERLSRQAQEMTGSLSMVTVTEAVLDTIREEFGAIAAILLLDEVEPSQVRVVGGSFGLTQTPPQRVVMDASGTGAVPSEVVACLPAGERLMAPLASARTERGCLVVVVPADHRTRGLQRRLDDLADEASLALDNARVFEGIRSLTLDDERARLARDLHDGVIQSLVHVGFELELLATQVEPGAREDATRLRKVVAQAVDEVRGTVQDLRSVRLADGLGPALEALARDHQSAGVVVEADPSPVAGLTPEAELQLLRIAQEAVSNAVQHAGPQRVDVLLWPSDRGVHLQVTDDGVGMQAGDGATSAGRGVGLRAMKERTELLGATLTVEPGLHGGTTIRVDIPWERVRP